MEENKQASIDEINDAHNEAVKSEIVADIISETTIADNEADLIVSDAMAVDQQAGQSNTNETIIEEKSPKVKITKGQKYKKYKRMMKTTKGMAICSSRVDMFKYLAKQFKKLKDYKKSEELAEKCTKLAKKTKKLIKKQTYEDALNLKENAKSVQDYKIAADTFHKLSGYLDADELAAECDKLAARYEKKSAIRRILLMTTVIIIVVASIIFANTASTKYYTANLLLKTGSYNSAIKIYNKLGDYKEARENKYKAQYLKGKELLDKGNHNDALAAFKEATDYEDSRRYIADIEKLIIKNSAINDTVKLGKFDWKILDIRDNKALLAKKTVIDGIAYNNSLVDTSWETSTLRQWLNSDFLSQSFSDEERSSIVLSELDNIANSYTAIQAGNSTKDYIFILSLDEAQNYVDGLSKTEKNTWLRTPGSNLTTAAFLSSDKTIMENGYPVNSDKLAVRPVLWYNLD